MLTEYLTEAKVARDRAMGKLHKTNVLFVNQAMEAVERVASRHREFIVDDVWFELFRNLDFIEPTDRRAVGIALREAAKLGVIRPTTRFEASVQAQCHSNPRRVWQSLTYDSAL